jgi:pentatricopeptide repeat protein
MNHRNRWILRLRLLLVGIPFLQQFAAYVLPSNTVGRPLRQQQNPICLFAQNKRPRSTAQNSLEPQQQQQQQQDPFQAGFSSPPEKSNKVTTTLGGGAPLMFEMIRKRMLDLQSPEEAPQPKVLPRWHPHSGISDVNPNFRNQAPAMSNQGFAKSIWRNVRKRNKPSLWQNAIRTYDRMAILEQDPVQLKIQRSNTHHEGVLLACAKLGLWQRALEIYHDVYQIEQDSQAQFTIGQQQSLRTPGSSTQATQKTKIRRKVHVTDNMILSLVRACVRASHQRSHKTTQGQVVLSPEQQEEEAFLRRIPLDTALEVLVTLQESHDIALVARHINPLAAAYQSLGYIEPAQDILQTMLSNRTTEDQEDITLDGMMIDFMNVNDLNSKDKSSYSLLVQAAVATGDWGAAVEALGDMTDAGLYPDRRHCNVWSEISERQTRPRAVGSWKKKRDDNWTDSVR